MASYVVLPDGSKCYAGPNCLRHGVGNKLSPDFALKTPSQKLEELERINNPLASKTPVEVDEVLAGLYESYFVEQSAVQRLEQNLDYTKNNIKRYPARAEYFQKRVDEIEKELVVAKNSANAVMQEMLPYQTEYRRRPWSRGFLVQNANGHVHKSMECSTCTPSTRYLWLTDYSGATEQELVEDAGQQACTVCFPSAPVETLNRAPRLKNTDLEAARKRKQDAADAKAKKQADALAKSITSPDGSPLKDYMDWDVKTLAKAESVAADVHAEMRAVREGKTQIYNEEFWVKRQEAYTRMMEAIAHKKGVTVEEATEQLQKKFNAKYKRDWS